MVGLVRGVGRRVALPLISVTAAQQNDGTARIWVLDVNNALYSNAQTSPGGDWAGWSP